MWHRLVLLLLIVANILNMFLDRTGEEGSRTLIQAINGAAFICLCISMFKNKITYPSFFKFLSVLLGILGFYYLFQLVSPNPYFNFGQYVRLALSLCLFFGFYTYEDSKISNKLLGVYAITFIIQCSLKIFNGNAFAAIEDLNQKVGGDTASIGLALCIPLIFYAFKDKLAFILFVISFGITLLSLRRTSILAFVVALPFVWPYIKGHLNKKMLLVFAVAGIVAIYYVWQVVGAKILVRFLEYSDAGSGLESYGSGRTEFWSFIIDRYFDGGSLLFGYGMGSIYEAYSKYWDLPLSHAHNDFLELLYTFGVIGLLLWCIYIYKLWVYNRYSNNISTKRLLYCALVVYLFVAITSGCIIRAEFFPLAISISLLVNKTDNYQVYDS